MHRLLGHQATLLPAMIGLRTLQRHCGSQLASKQQVCCASAHWFESCQQPQLDFVVSGQGRAWGVAADGALLKLGRGVHLVLSFAWGIAEACPWRSCAPAERAAACAQVTSAGCAEHEQRTPAYTNSSSPPRPACCHVCACARATGRPCTGDGPVSCPQPCTVKQRTQGRLDLVRARPRGSTAAGQVSALAGAKAGGWRGGLGGQRLCTHCVLPASGLSRRWAT